MVEAVWRDLLFLTHSAPDAAWPISSRSIKRK
jgi:hypothetical protein